MKPWQAFAAIQHKPKRLKYMLSTRTAHEQALREHIKRGYKEPAYGHLLDMANVIKRKAGLAKLTAYDQELGI